MQIGADKTDYVPSAKPEKVRPHRGLRNWAGNFLANLPRVGATRTALVGVPAPIFN